MLTEDTDLRRLRVPTRVFRSPPRSRRCEARSIKGTEIVCYLWHILDLVPEPPRKLGWLVDSLERLTGFPPRIRQKLGFALYQAQIGQKKREDPAWLCRSSLAGAGGRSEWDVSSGLRHTAWGSDLCPSRFSEEGHSRCFLLLLGQDIEIRVKEKPGGRSRRDSSLYLFWYAKGVTWTVETLNEIVDAELEMLPEDMRARLARIATLIEEKDLERVGEPHVKHVEGRLWEMRLKGRSGIARALYVAGSGRRVVIVRVFVKKTEKTPRNEIELALRRAKSVR